MTLRKSTPKSSKSPINAEIAEVKAALQRSVDQTQRGDAAALHTPKQITARRVGRPVGSVKAAPKVPTTIRLSSEMSTAVRATGDG